MNVIPKLFQVFLIFPALCFIRWADSVLPAVGALLRLADTAEQEVALITSKNHFHHQGISIATFVRFCNYKFPQEGAARPLHFLAQKEGYL